MHDLILEKGAEQARRHGMDRREFMASSMGVTLSLSVVNLINGCSGNGDGGYNVNAGGDAGSRGSGPPNPFDAGGGVPPGAGSSGMDGSIISPPDAGSTRDSGNAPMPDAMTGDPDPVMCDQALDYTDMFIFDIQTHRVESAPGVYRSFLSFLPQGGCGKGVPGCFSKDEYIRQMFLESDTTMTVLSGVPAVDGANPLTNDQIAETRDYVNGLASETERIITHGMVLPNYNREVQLEGMATLAAERSPLGGWKCYTPWGPGDGVSGFWLDDPAIGIPFIERGRELGLNLFCCHKGLPLPGFDNTYGDPKDIGVVASRFPDCQFVVYHSAYEYGSSDENRPYTMGSKDGVNSLVTACMDNGLGPGSNVYGELGTTWYRLMNSPQAATHVLGKLLKYLGEDNIVWGTDSMWYGSPQPQIIAFMSFTMDEAIRAQEGYPELTPAIKAKILGLNAAKIFKVDPTLTRCGFDAGAIAQLKRQLDGEFGRYRWAYQQPRMTTRRDFFASVRFHKEIKSPG